MRAGFNEMIAAMGADLFDSPHVTKEDCFVPGPESAPPVPIRVYRPIRVTAPLPALVWIHGGGMVLGNIAMDDYQVQDVVETVGCLGVSVEYRLAPEHHFPAPLEDCYAAPARATDLGNLPPTYIQVGSQDLFLDRPHRSAEARAAHRTRTSGAALTDVGVAPSFPGVSQQGETDSGIHLTPTFRYGNV